MPYTPAGVLTIVNSYPKHPAYFENLTDLDAYLGNVPKPIPPPGEPLRVRVPPGRGHGKLCICHDMMGGYPDDAHNPMWTFQWWALADTFIYFSHHRVSPPPREWINAGHRQGCKVLGTLILESTTDRYRILTGHDTPSLGPDTNSISKKYADSLIDLCELRGFDGYLLNFEVPYENPHNARLLGAWVAYLTSESRRRLGPDRSVIMWYDSVTVKGDLWWQNTLNQLNSAFFIASDSIFTNYNYSNTTIPAAKNFLENLVGKTRPTADVSWGIDMWGRGTYEGGGYRACLAMNTIQPGPPIEQNGFSASVFAPAYLWESDVFSPHDRPAWWARDSLLWVGRSTQQKTLEDLQRLNTDPNKQFGPGDVFRPLDSYFPFQPQTLPFATNFSLGAGTFFNVEGGQVQPNLVWSDHEWVAPMPNLAMPCSRAIGSKGQAVIVEAEWISDPQKVWTGGHSLQLTCPTYKDEYGVLYAPLVTVDLRNGPEYGCVTMFEVTWYQAAHAGVQHLSVQQGNERSAGSYKTIEEKLPQAGWVKTTAFFENLTGVVGFGVTLSFEAGQNIPVVLGALSIKAVSGKANGSAYLPNITYIDAKDLQASFTDIPGGFATTLEWSSNVRPPVSDGQTNPAWPTICQTTLNEDAVTYEVSTLLAVTNSPIRIALAWGTTSMYRQTINVKWSDHALLEKITQAEKQGGFIAFKVQALDGSGSYAGSPAEIRVSFTQRKLLH